MYVSFLNLAFNIVTLDHFSRQWGMKQSAVGIDSLGLHGQTHSVYFLVDQGMAGNCISKARKVCEEKLSRRTARQRSGEFLVRQDCTSTYFSGNVSSHLFGYYISRVIACPVTCECFLFLP